jgi:hypothetical protein
MAEGGQGKERRFVANDVMVEGKGLSEFESRKAHRRYFLSFLIEFCVLST